MLAPAFAFVDVHVLLPQCCGDHLELAHVHAHGLDKSLLVLADVSAVEHVIGQKVVGQCGVLVKRCESDHPSPTAGDARRRWFVRLSLLP